MDSINGIIIQSWGIIFENSLLFPIFINLFSYKCLHLIFKREKQVH